MEGFLAKILFFFKLILHRATVVLLESKDLHFNCYNCFKSGLQLLKKMLDPSLIQSISNLKRKLRLKETLAFACGHLLSWQNVVAHHQCSRKEGLLLQCLSPYSSMAEPNVLTAPWQGDSTFTVTLLECSE